MPFDERLLQQVLQPMMGGQQQGQQTPDRRGDMLRGVGFMDQMRRLAPLGGMGGAGGALGMPGLAGAAMGGGGTGLWLGMLTNALAKRPNREQASADNQLAALNASPAIRSMMSGTGLRANTANMQANTANMQANTANMMANPKALQANAAVNPDAMFNPKAFEPQLPVFKGHLEVDEKNGRITTPGGYCITVKDGVVRIELTKGKFTSLKAEPPGRQVSHVAKSKESRKTETVERVLPRDPAVRESDGDIWRYQGTGSFILPDGTKITIQETGTDKDLHINQIDVYNGDKHVNVRSILTKCDWKTVRTEKQTSAGKWETVASKRETKQSGRDRRVVRTDSQSRDVTTTTIEHQEAVQEFKTVFSGVSNDADAHDKELGDGFQFQLARGGDAWAHKGREVMSGAGKGKDDKTKAFQLGDKLDHD